MEKINTSSLSVICKLESQESQGDLLYLVGLRALLKCGVPLLPMSLRMGTEVPACFADLSLLGAFSRLFGCVRSRTLDMEIIMSNVF